MNKEMIISSNGHETRVAILEDDQLAEIFVERERNAASSATSTRAGSRRCCPACSRRSSTSASSATASSTSPTSSANLEEFDGSSRGRGRRPADGRSGEADAGRGAKAAGGDAATAGARPRRRTATRDASRRAEDRRPAEGRAGRRRAGGQGAARHQGRAPDLARDAARPLPGVHADRGPHRHLAQDRHPRGAHAPARHRQGVPRAAQLRRRRHHPHRGRGPVQGRHPRRPQLLPQDLDRHAAEVREPPRARPSSTRSPAWSPSCSAICSPTTTPRSASTIRQEHQRVARVHRPHHADARRRG